MTDKRTVPCHGCGWRYSGSLSKTTAKDHAASCPVYLKMVEVQNR